MNLDWTKILTDPAWWALLISIGALAASVISAKQSKKSAAEAKRSNDFTEDNREPWIVLEPKGTTARIRNNSNLERYDVIIQSPNGGESSRDRVGPWEILEIQTMRGLASPASSALIIRWSDKKDKDSEKVSRTWEA